MTSTHRWLRAHEEDTGPLESAASRTQEKRESEPVPLPHAERRRRVGELVANVRRSLERALERPDARPAEHEALSKALDSLTRLEAEVLTLAGPRSADEPSGVFTLPDDGIPLEVVERTLVEQALERAGGNRTRAGELLGLTRDQVRYRIDKFGLHGGERS